MEENEKTEGIDSPAKDLKNKSGVLKKITNSITAGGAKIKNKANETINELKEKHSLEKHFNIGGVTCINVASEKTFHALKNMNDNTLLVPTKVKLELKSIIISNGQTFEIIDSDFQEIPYSMEGNSQTIPCYLYKYRIKENQPTAVHNTINQSLTIQGNNSGDINMVAQAEKSLLDIYTAIQNVNPTLFNKGKKNEALQLFGSFKNCIINKQPDKTLFDKFINILKALIPSAATIAVSLIQTVFPH